MLLDAAVYGLDHGSQMSASPFDYLFHTIASYLPFFENAHLDNVHGRCCRMGPRCQPFEQETCAMLDYFVLIDGYLTFIFESARKI
jgi:hypothetical protein